MASIERTAYPRFSKNKKLSQKELIQIYTPSADEIHMGKTYTKDLKNKLNFLILLKSFQRLGYFPEFSNIPSDIIKHIVTTLGHENYPATGYSNNKTLHLHKKVIKEIMSVSGYNEKAKQLSEKTAFNAALKMNNPADIINVLIEELLFNRFELPAFSTIDRLVNYCKAKANNQIFDEINKKIPEPMILFFDALLKTSESKQRTGYNAIKTLPKRATIGNFQDFLSHYEWLMSIGDVAPYLNGVAKTKIKEFFSEANSLDASDVRRLSGPKKYALIVCLLYENQTKGKDSLTRMFCRTIKKIDKQAKEKLEQLKRDNSGKILEAVELLSEIIQIISNPNESMSELLKKKLDERGGFHHLQRMCDELMSLINKDHLFLLCQFMTHRKRKALYTVLKTLKLVSSTRDNKIIMAINFLLKNENNKNDQIETGVDISFMSDAWKKIIFPKKGEETYLMRRHFEIGVLSYIETELRSGDLYVKGSDAFSDYREQLLKWNECSSNVGSYCKDLGLPDNKKDFISELKNRLINASENLDKNFNQIKEFVFDKTGIPILKKRTPKNKKISELQNEINKRMSERNILDILCSTHHYTGWANHFGPISGSDPKINNAEEKHILTSFAYGSSMGPTQGAKHFKGIDISAHILSWINRRHITTQSLDKAITNLINHTNKFELISSWGDGKSCAADGTLCNIYEDNLMAEYHVRYSRKGGVAYYHISNNYIALFSTFIPCGVWEAIAIIDGILNNKSEIQPDTIHADTQGQSTTVFGLSYLLGIKLMPRIRNWKDLILFKAHQNMKYKNVDSLFAGTIKWSLISDHWEDMMQVILSIKEGKISSSFLLQKLTNYSRKNKLFKAFQELGRVIRTLFLIEYISKVELREEITASTNKVESYNDFSQWLRFGTEYYMVSSHSPDEQEKAVKYNCLLSNAIILQNVVDMTNIIHTLMAEGYDIKKEELRKLSPYIRHHIKRFGEYFMDFLAAKFIPERQPVELW